MRGWPLAIGRGANVAFFLWRLALSAVAGWLGDTLQPGLELALCGADGFRVAPSVAPRSVIDHIGRRPVLSFVVAQIDPIFSGNLDYFC